MRLLFDLQPLIQSSRFGITGIARWTLNGIHALKAQAPDWQIEGFAVIDSRHSQDHARPTPLESGRRLVPLWNGPVWLLPGDGLPVDWGEDAPDAILGTAFLTPPAGGPAEIPVVHDLAFTKFPETQAVETLKLLGADLRGVIERASLVVTVSRAMKEEIAQQYGLDRSIIEIVYPGFNPEAAKQGTDQTDTFEIPAEVPRDFFVVVGTLEPRKNIRTILQAHHAIRQRRPEFPKLVLAGGMGWRKEQFSEALEEQIASGHVIWLGYVSQPLLQALYNRAIALVFPSLYEGFGLPIIEAMAAGCAVITSDCTGTLEAGGDAAILVDPKDGMEIQQAIERIYDESALREELKKKGRLQASRFTWQRMGASLKAAITRAVDLNS